MPSWRWTWASPPPIGAASAKPRLDIVIRNEINKGKIPGPRLLAGSPELTVTGGLADDNQLDAKHPSISIICDGAGRVPQGRCAR